jgi:hypothetical protein
MADTPRLVSSMGRAELDRIFVRGYDLNQERWTWGLTGGLTGRCPRASRSWAARWAAWLTSEKKFGRPIARGISSLIQDNLQYEPEK